MLDQNMRASTFMKLPTELHLEIISDLQSSDLENLRLVSGYSYDLANKLLDRDCHWKSLLAGLKMTNPQDGDPDLKKINAYLSRWNKVGRNSALTVEIGPKSVQIRTVNKGYLVSIARRDGVPVSARILRGVDGQSMVSFHFARLPSPWIREVQPCTMNIEIPIHRKWSFSWAICPFRKRLAVASSVVENDGSFTVDLFEMRDGAEFRGDSQSKIKCDSEGEILGVDLLLTSFCLAAKVTTIGTAGGFNIFVWNLESRDFMRVFGAADANFIDEYRLLSLSVGGKLLLWDFKSFNWAPRVKFTLGPEDIGPIGPGWVILRNYEFDQTKTLSVNPGVGIVGIFPRSKSTPRKGLVIPVSTFLKETRTEVEWEDWRQSVTVLDPPKDYNLYVFHTHVLCLHPLTLEYHVFDFSPYATRLNAPARGGVPDWVSSLSEPWTRPATFSGKIEGLNHAGPFAEIFPTEDGILTIKSGARVGTFVVAGNYPGDNK